MLPDACFPGPQALKMSGLQDYGTAQAQRCTHSHMQFCSRVLKSLIKGHGKLFRSCEQNSCHAVS